MTDKHVFPAGNYWIGDICYAIKDSKWKGMIKSTGCFGLEMNSKVKNWNDGCFTYNGEKCFVDGTAYGDGCYLDNHAKEYGVDAGLIGIMPLGACDGDSLNGGHPIRFEYDFEVYADNGVFYFGDVIINTRDQDDIEEDEY